MRQLDLETRNTTIVIETFERGWFDRPPEDDNLVSMLPELGHLQELTQSVLWPVLPPAVERQLKTALYQRRFT